MEVSKRTAFHVGLLVFTVAAITIACFTLPIDKMLKDFLVWIDSNLGPWGPVVLAFAYIPLTVLAVPASILTLGGGYLFGLPVGFLADSIGSTMGCTAAFIVGKTIGRSYVESKLMDYPKFQAVAIASRRSGFKIVLLLRLVPFLPFNMLNYLLSVTPIGLVQYILASWIGMMPITLALVYIGTTIKDLSDVTHGWSGNPTTRWMTLGAVIVVSAIIIYFLSRIAKKSLEKALEENAGLDSITVQVDTASEVVTDIRQPLLVKIEPIDCNADNEQMIVRK